MSSTFLRSLVTDGETWPCFLFIFSCCSSADVSFSCSIRVSVSSDLQRCKTTWWFVHLQAVPTVQFIQLWDMLGERGRKSYTLIFNKLQCWDQTTGCFCSSRWSLDQIRQIHQNEIKHQSSSSVLLLLLLLLLHNVPERVLKVVKQVLTQ